MTDKVRINTDFILTSGPNTNNPSDISKLGLSFEKEIKESSRIKIQIAAEGTESVALPDAACNFVAIYADQNIEVALNEAETSELLKTLKPGIKAPVLMKACDLTALSVTNPSETKLVNLDIFILKI